VVCEQAGIQVTASSLLQISNRYLQNFHCFWLLSSFSDVERQIIELLANSFIGVNIHNHWIRIQFQVFDEQN
jgi:hypothetical protein